MADGARNPSGKGSAFERRAWSAATSTGAPRRSSPAGSRVRSIRASSISLSRESVPARSPRRNSRGHNTGHFEASATNRRTSPEIREKQRSDYRGNRSRRVACLSAYSQKAWLSRIQEATHFESISHIHLIDTIASPYHRPQCGAGARRLCEVWLRLVVNLDANQRTENSLLQVP
jgi:hypothetical protein